jgi:hypothetical protein
MKRSTIKSHGLRFTASILCALFTAIAAAQQPPPPNGQFLTDNLLSPPPPAAVPPYDIVPTEPAAKLASYPRDFTEPLLGEPDNFVLLPELQQPKAPTQRDGFFQRIAGTTTYLPRFGDNSVGFWDTEVWAVFGVPFPTRDMPLLIEPGTDFWVVDAPHFNLSSTLHDDYVEFRWLAKLTDIWAADIMVTPGWHSDYHNPNSSQAFRVESHAVGVYTWSPTLKIALGVAYWDRLNTKFVPAGGIIWTPNPDCRFELMTPKPKIAFRIDCDPCYERWVYIAGEFGGGEWAIRQEGGVDNILDYTDYKIMLGIEHKSLCLGVNGFAEIGYVFGRQLQYQTGPDQNLPTTMMARLGLSY